VFELSRRLGDHSIFYILQCLALLLRGLPKGSYSSFLLLVAYEFTEKRFKKSEIEPLK